MFIMENVWKSIYFQPTLCERPLLPFYQLGNLSCQFHQGAKMNRWLRGGSHKAIGEKSLPSPDWGILRLLTDCSLWKNMCVQCDNSFPLHTFQISTVTVTVTVCEQQCSSQSATLYYLFKCDNMYLGIWCEHLCCCSAFVAFLLSREWQT